MGIRTFDGLERGHGAVEGMDCRQTRSESAPLAPSEVMRGIDAVILGEMMPDLSKLAEAVLGQALPVGYISLVSYSMIRLGRFLDDHLKPAVRSASIAYLREGRFKDTSDSMIDAAANALTVVYGPRHFSLRCLAASTLVSVGSILLLLSISLLMSFAISRFGNADVNAALKAYWTTASQLGISGSVTWMAWSVVIDYISLFKTRILIRFIRNKRYTIPIFCVIDFALGFMIYIFGFFMLTILPIYAGFYWMSPPIVSAETAFASMSVLMTLAKFNLPVFHALVAANGQVNEVMLQLINSNMPYTFYLILSLIQLVPFVTIGSDLFYASMMPSIWLWLFLCSVALAKAFVWVGSYLRFALTRTRRDKQSLKVTAQLLLPVLWFVTSLAMLWPYAIAVLWFVADALLGLMGLLGEQMTMPTPAP